MTDKFCGDMKIPAKISGLAATASVFALAVNLQAEASAPSKTAATTKSKTATAGAARGAVGRVGITRSASIGLSSGLLEQAYRLLTTADHDYKGHRALAVRHVKEAAQLVGERVAGGRAGHEAQGSSDEQLRKAQSLLQEASGNMSGQAHQHIETALHELTIALRVK
jgi:hypothetical protein